MSHAISTWKSANRHETTKDRVKRVIQLTIEHQQRIIHTTREVTEQHMNTQYEESKHEHNQVETSLIILDKIFTQKRRIILSRYLAKWCYNHSLSILCENFEESSDEREEEEEP